MRTWFETVKKEHLFTLFATLGLVAVANAVHAATGGGVAAWAPMGTMMDSVQGVPAFTAGTAMIIGGAVTLGMGEIGIGAKRVALGVGAAGLMTNAAATANAWGVTGALS